MNAHARRQPCPRPERTPVRASATAVSSTIVGVSTWAAAVLAASDAAHVGLYINHCDPDDVAPARHVRRRRWTASAAAGVTTWATTMLVATDAVHAGLPVNHCEPVEPLS